MWVRGFLLSPSHVSSPPSPPRPQAMEVLDVQMAVHVYRQLGDAGMVMGLEQIAYVEDKNLLAGHVALLFGNYQTAQVGDRRKDSQAVALTKIAARRHPPRDSPAKDCFCRAGWGSRADSSMALRYGEVSVVLPKERLRSSLLRARSRQKGRSTKT